MTPVTDLPPSPPYIDRLLDRSGEASPFLHLGHWDDPANADQDLLAAQQRLNDRVLALGVLADGQRVLDIGCGVGGTIAGLLRAYPRMEVVGVDIGTRQLEHTRKRIFGDDMGRVELVRADACALPFPAQSFERLLVIEAAFHFSSRRTFLAEASRVLRPGGVMVLSDILPGPRLGELEQREGLAFAVGAVIHEGLGPWPDFWGRELSIEALASEHGLRVHTRVDATHSTLPSYRLLLGQQARALPGTEQDQDPTTRAVALLEWLQANEMLRVIYLGLER